MNPPFHPNLTFAPNKFPFDSTSSAIPQHEEEHVEWTWQENKIFEDTLAEFSPELEILLPTLALRLPRKSISQMNDHYRALVEDYGMIKGDPLGIPNYEVSNNLQSSQVKSDDNKRGKNRSVSGERKRPTPWRTSEHELFLQGLENIGAGDWKGISNSYVKTRTPAQIASHAQKYFKKLNNTKAHKKDGTIMRTISDSSSTKQPSTNSDVVVTSIPLHNVSNSSGVAVTSMHTEVIQNTFFHY